MMKPGSDVGHPVNWSKTTSDQHSLVMKNEKRKSSSSKRKHKRKSSKSMLSRFRRAARIVVLLLRGFRQTKIYFTDEEAELKTEKRLRDILRPVNDDDDDDDDADRRRATSSRKCMIGHRLHLCLTTTPQHRNDTTIRQISWFLKATKAFKNLFPIEMEKEVAKYVEYARYDEGRVISCQGRRPEYLYFIISGRVKLVRQFRLLNGVITKFMGYIEKGETTDPDELSEQWLREDNLVAQGQVEMLLLKKEVFAYLQHTTDGPPLDFIRSLRFFQGFPVESLVDNPDAIELKYYGDGKIVVADSNRTPWIYIIKTGFVKVVRRQLINKSSAQRRRTLNDGRRRQLIWPDGDQQQPTDAANSKVMVKFNVEQIHLPKVTEEVHLLNELHLPVKKQHRNTNLSIEIHYKEISNSQSLICRKGNRKPCRKLSRRSNAIAEIDSSKIDERQEHSSTAILPISEETAQDLRLFPLLSRSEREEKHRMTFLQLDTLTTGDIFGLDHLQPTVASEPNGVSLVSGGAEIIQMKKRFYMNHFGNDGLHDTDSVCKEYISEKKAEEDLLNQESWRRYKAAVYEKATTGYGCNSSKLTTASSSSSSRRVNR